MTEYPKFRRFFDKSFWKTLKRSLVPWAMAEAPQNKDDIIQELHRDICNRNYFPSLPREYIVSNKHNFVSRIVPTFSYRDACVYFFCIKILEDDIAKNRIEGTFGGWKLGNSIRTKEDNEKNEDDDEIISNDEYAPSVSFNQAAWGENWQGFQLLAYEYSSGNYKYFIKFDIANFYDSINLTLLENKIRMLASNKKKQIIDLLFTFLGYWNRRFEGYVRKTVGLPQDEIGDCSRILANFYLQDYDQFLFKLYEENNSRYLRYADDQIIFAPSKETARKILFSASQELSKINLNINSGKVIEFDSRDKFNSYWAFELFKLLKEPNNSKNVNKAVRLFLELNKNGTKFRRDSALKRILYLDFSIIELDLRYSLLSIIYEPDFLADRDDWYLNRIFANSINKDELFNALDKLVDNVLFNSFHYNLLKFYKKNRPDHSNDRLLQRIKDLQFK